MRRYAALTALALAACDGGLAATVHSMGEPAPVVACDCPAFAPPSRYLRTAYQGAAPGARAEVSALCDAGDVVVSGGCTFGKAPGTMAAVTFGPTETLDAWACEGLSTAATQTAVYAVALCEVQ